MIQNANDNITVTKERRALFWYLILTFLFGTIGYLPWVLSSYGIIPFLMFSVYLGGLSPLIGALIASRMVYGRKGPKYISSQIGLNIRESTGWIVIAYLIPIIEALAMLFLYNIFIGPYDLSSTNWFELIPASIIFTFFALGEEFGWRGFALPHFQEKYRPIVAALIVGIFWATWHWPHFLLKDSEMLNLYGSIWMFLIISILNSTIYTFLYNKGKGCLMTAAVIHGASNASLVLNLPIDISQLLIMKLLIVVFLVIFFRKSLIFNEEKISFVEIMKDINLKTKTKADEDRKGDLS